MATRCLPEVRQRAVGLVWDGAGDHGSQWSATGTVVTKIGFMAETLQLRMWQVARDSSKRAKPTREERGQAGEKSGSEVTDASGPGRSSRNRS
jgi:hypothetical protein